MDQIYSATYSGVDVFEFLTPSGSVMMRKSDGWVNATHILKTANFPKAKRTRILERDVQVGVHDKVQGGYGKYQGTYVPLDRARSIAQEFGVADVLEPLFDAKQKYADSNPPPAPKHHHASKNSSLVAVKPTNSRKAALARKISSMPAVSSTTDSLKKKGRPAKKSKSTVSNPNEGVFVGRRIQSSERESRTELSFNEGAETGDDDDTGLESEAEMNENDGLDSEIDDSTNFHLLDGTSSPSELLSETDLADALKSPNQRKGRSARESLEQAISNGQIDPMRSEKWIDESAEYTGRLLDFFTQPDDSTESQIPEFLQHAPKGVSFDQVIDDDGHTIFHWACAMGNLQVVQALINMGANYRAVNNLGETPLMRTVKFTNAFTRRTFPRLVELLSENIFEFDSSFRTVLHHIAAAAQSKQRVSSALYYMEIILAKVSESQTAQRMEDFINSQDENGDTALHICARYSNRKCIKLLIEYKAKGNIRNNEGQVASDILLGDSNTSSHLQQRYQMHLKSKGMEVQIPTPANSTANTTGGTTVAAPHVSEAAIEATHKVAHILLEALHDLSDAYDYELQRKEADVAEVQQLVSHLNEDIRSMRSQTMEFIGAKTDERALGERLLLVEDQIKRYEGLVHGKETKLKRLLERSQKKSLDLLFKKFEGQPLNPHSDAVELSRLQIQRKKMLNEILRLSEGFNNDKMEKYRRLVSASADIPIEQVSDKLDELLHEIESESI